MDLRVLEYFLFVADIGNMTKAAEILHVSQPTISRQLMELEEEIGKKLLVRGNRKVFLTKEGSIFRETARDILTLYRRAKSEQTEENELVGDIYLGAGETKTFSYLAEKINAFHCLYPKVHFHIVSENGERIQEDIDKGLLDFGFLQRSFSTVNYESLEFDLTEHWGILIREDDPLAKRTSVDVKELQKLPLLLPENDIFRRDLLQWIGRKPNVTATYNLIYHAYFLVKAGLGMAVCLGDENTSGNGFVFLPIEPICSIHSLLIWKKKPIMAPAVQRFIYFLNHAENTSK